MGGIVTECEVFTVSRHLDQCRMERQFVGSSYKNKFNEKFFMIVHISNCYMNVICMSV